MADRARNVWCRFYPACLDRAASMNVDFSCLGCEHEGNRDGEKDSDEIGSCLLLAALFKPWAYHAYREEKAFLALTSSPAGDLSS